MEEVRVNVRSRGGQLGQAGLRGPPPSFVPPFGPPRVYHPSHPTPVFPHFLFLPRSRRPPGTGRGGFATRLEETKEVVGVCRGGGRKKRAEGVRSEPRSILASPAGWTRPDIAFRSSPSRRYQATLPTNHSTPCTPAAGPHFFLPFVPPLSLGRSALSANPRDLHPHCVETNWGFRRKENFFFCFRGVSYNFSIY